MSTICQIRLIPAPDRDGFASAHTSAPHLQRLKVSSLSGDLLTYSTMSQGHSSLSGCNCISTSNVRPINACDCCAAPPTNLPQYAASSSAPYIPTAHLSRVTARWPKRPHGRIGCISAARLRQRIATAQPTLHSSTSASLQAFLSCVACPMARICASNSTQTPSAVYLCNTYADDPPRQRLYGGTPLCPRTGLDEALSFNMQHVSRGEYTARLEL